MRLKWINLSLIALLAMSFSLFTVSCEKEDIAKLEKVSKSTDGESYSISEAGNCEPLVVELLAGQDIEVGTVTVTNDDEKICVTYELNDWALDEGWLIYETHLAIAKDFDDIPTNRPGNPIPGQFPYGDDELDGLPYWQVCIPFDELDVDCGDEVYIAAHAVVNIIDCLPEEVNFNIRDWANPNTFRIIVDEIEYDGLGWCADAGTRIESGTSVFYDGNVYVSTSLPEDTPWCVADRPWGSINWILNNWYPDYSSGDAQIAMWSLIHDYDFNQYGSTNFYGLTWNQTNVDELLDLAEGQDDFEPEPEDLVAVVLLVGDQCPENYDFTVPPWVVDRGDAKQMVFIGIPRKDAECRIEEETAWGFGDRFVERGNWATYFTYTICCDFDNGNGDCQTETAWGGDSEGGGAAWWFYYDASVGGEQTIWAGQHIDVGTVEVVDGTVEITLTGGWELQPYQYENGELVLDDYGNPIPEEESVKIKGYDEIPDSRPAAGQFDYKGTDLTVNIGVYDYYAIHLDVQLCPQP